MEFVKYEHCNVCSKEICKGNLICEFCMKPFHSKCTLVSNSAVLPPKKTLTQQPSYCKKCACELFPFPMEDELYANYTQLNFNSPLNHICGEMYYQPFISSEKHFLTNDGTIDPDNNFFSEINLGCKYYGESEMKAINSEWNKTFSILHLNCRTIKKNFTKLSILLKSLETDFDVIAISETWLNESEHELFDIQDYTCTFISRNEKRGGGVGLYVKNKYTFKLLGNISKCNKIYPNNTVDSVFIEVDNGKQKNVIIGCIYNPPGNAFNNYLSNFFKEISTKPCYLAGNFNMNLLNHEKHNETSIFLETLYSVGLFPLINHPTRIRDNSAIQL